MDSISLEGMEFFGYHGVRSEERTLGQRFLVSVTVLADLRRAGETDSLDATVDYSALYRVVKQVVEGEPKNLLEAVAEEIARRALAELAVDEARVSVTKLSPPIPGATGVRATASVERRRERH